VAGLKVSGQPQQASKAELGTAVSARDLADANDTLKRLGDTLAARVAELESERARTLDLARTDALTGLYNRGAFTTALAETSAAAAAAGQRVGLHVIDLDRFKHVNDALGHHAGDLLLREIAQRLLNLAGPGDTVARLGGDEFAVIAIDPPPGFAAAIVAVLSQPFHVLGRNLSPGASVGVAVFPDDSTDPVDLARFADLALYRAKSQGRGGWAEFDASLREESEQRNHREAELRLAIPAGEIVPWFQPVVDARTGAIVSLEVLARWQHPKDGLLPPAVFISLAEELGLVGKLDEAVFSAACEIAAPWIAQGLVSSIACNLSPRELLDPDFSRRFIRRLNATALPPTALVVEITETFLMDDLELAGRHIARLAACGVRVALDDFGTGYSNFRALMSLPIDTLKIDQSLIAGVGSDPRITQVIRALLQTARSLGVTLVAEGVEDEAQAVFLRAAGCDHMQGYLFARPMSPEDTYARLKSQPTVDRSPDRNMGVLRAFSRGR
jgi:diguanylate cyclase (GGDEF)-like protein